MKNIKLKKRSQFLTMLIIAAALVGVLVLNTNFVTAEESFTAKKAVTEKAQTEEKYGGFASDALPSLLKVGFALLVVVIAIYAGIYLLKKMMGKKYSGNKKNNILEVLETTYIGPKKTISLIKVADKSVLVASTESQISMLTEMDSEATKEILSQITVEKEQPDQFAAMFQSAFGKIKELSPLAKRDVLENVQSQTK